MDSPVADAQTETETDTSLPNISDYWPDAPQRLGPPADHYEAPGAEPARTAPIWHGPAGVDRPTVEIPVGERPRRPVRTAGAVLAALLTAGGVTAWLVNRSEPETPPPTFADGAASPAPTAAQPANPPVSIGTPPPSAPPSTAIPDAATFEFVDNTTELTVTIGSVEEGWFRVTTPRGSGVKPRVQLDGAALRVGIEPTGEKGSGRIDVLLSEDVDWTVRTRGGFRTAALDLTGGSVDRVDLLGGVAELDLALPRLRAELPIVLAGGAREWRITTDGRVPVRAAFRRGAGKVTLYGDREKGIERGDELSAGSGSDGIDLNAEEGVGTLTVVAR